MEGSHLWVFPTEAINRVSGTGNVGVIAGKKRLLWDLTLKMVKAYPVDVFKKKCYLMPLKPMENLGQKFIQRGKILSRDVIIRDVKDIQIMEEEEF